MIHTGDCIEVMRGMEADSVDAVVTDPPAGIAFMSKHWDRDKGGRTEWVAWMTEVMRECYRVLKPGGYAVVWSLPRTCHWTAWAMEDAGFIIRDQLAHIFASGFPKGKAQLKPAREDWWLARKPGPLQPLQIDATRIGHNGDIANADGGGSGAGRATANLEGPAYGKGLGGIVAQPHEGGRWPSNVLLSDPELFDEPNPYVVGSGATATSGNLGPNNVERYGHWGEREPWRPTKEYGGDSGGYSRFFIIPKADRADREPIVRGQLEAGRSGTGALRAEQGGEYVDFVHSPPEGMGAWLREQREAAGLQQKQVAAHFPSRTGGLTGCVANWELEFNRPTPEQWATLREVIGFDDRYDEVMTTVRSVPHAVREGTISVRENAHPTVKPTDLMRHLVRLVTPPGGTVLDPFLGSGSTAIACELEGFPWIGIEKEPEYVAIAEARLNGTQRGLGLDVPAPTKAPPKTHPDLSKHQPKVQRRPTQTVYGKFAGFDEEGDAA